MSSLDSFLDKNDKEVNQQTFWRPQINEEDLRAQEEEKRKHEKYLRAQKQGLLDAMKVQTPTAKYTPPTSGKLGLPLSIDRTNLGEISKFRQQFDYEISKTPPTEYALQILRQVRATELRTTRTRSEEKEALEDAMNALHEAKNRFNDLTTLTYYVEDR